MLGIPQPKVEPRAVTGRTIVAHLGQEIAVAPVKVEESLSAAKAGLTIAQASIVAKAKLAAKVGDDYVRANPWSAIGITAAEGAVVGALIARR